MNIAVIGTGYVGLVSGVCLASIGHNVVGIDIDADKVAGLQAGVPDIYEQDLEPLLLAALDAQRVTFSTRMQDLENADVVIIAVGTPQHESGEADLSAVYAVAEATRRHRRHEVDGARRNRASDTKDPLERRTIRRRRRFEPRVPPTGACGS